MVVVFFGIRIFRSIQYCTNFCFKVILYRKKVLSGRDSVGNMCIVPIIFSWSGPRSGRWFWYYFFHCRRSFSYRFEYIWLTVVGESAAIVREGDLSMLATVDTFDFWLMHPAPETRWA